MVKKSIKEIADSLKIDAFETAKIFYGLATSGLIRMKEKKRRKEGGEKGRRERINGLI